MIELKLKLTGKSIMTIFPKAVCAYMEIGLGDILEVEILEKDKMILRPKRGDK